MVNTQFALTPVTHRRLRSVILTYVGLVAATIVALVMLSATGSDQAPQEAWVHAIIVAVFAVLLPIRLRSAANGHVGGLRAVGIISGVLFLVNVIEAMLPMFPAWMRVEMVVFAILMLVAIGLVIRERV